MNTTAGPSLLTRFKASAKNMVFAVGGSDIWLWLMRARGADVSHLVPTNRRDRFSAIYDRRIWASSETESLSGDGSSLAATKDLRAALPSLISDLGVRTLLDLGCGDFNWMKEAQLDLQKYIGADIVSEVIRSNQKYSDAKHAFLVLDGCADPLPAADVVLCRETIFHLSFKDTKLLLKNVKDSGARFLLATTNPTVAINTDIPTGAFREINLSISPYRLGDPIRTIADGGWNIKTRALGVWPVDRIPT
jgi:hypothetical protein